MNVHEMPGIFACLLLLSAQQFLERRALAEAPPAVTDLQGVALDDLMWKLDLELFDRAPMVRDEHPLSTNGKSEYHVQSNTHHRENFYYTWAPARFAICRKMYPLADAILSTVAFDTFEPAPTPEIQRDLDAFRAKVAALGKLPAAAPAAGKAQPTLEKRVVFPDGVLSAIPEKARRESKGEFDKSDIPHFRQEISRRLIGKTVEFKAHIESVTVERNPDANAPAKEAWQVFFNVAFPIVQGRGMAKAHPIAITCRAGLYRYRTEDFLISSADPHNAIGKGLHAYILNCDEQTARKWDSKVPKDPTAAKAWSLGAGTITLHGSVWDVAVYDQITLFLADVTGTPHRLKGIWIQGC